MSRFSLKKTISDSGLEPFEFNDVNDEPQELPHLRTLTSRQIVMSMNGQIVELFSEITPGLVDQLLDLPNFALDALVREWQAHAGIEVDAEGNPVPGKSTSTSPSSKTTATSSRRTSRSGGSSRSKR